MACIPDGIARKDGNHTEVFLSDLGGLALMEENISEILLLVSGVTKPREPISMPLRLYPLFEMSENRSVYL